MLSLQLHPLSWLHHTRIFHADIYSKHPIIKTQHAHRQDKVIYPYLNRYPQANQLKPTNANRKLQMFLESK